MIKCPVSDLLYYVNLKAINFQLCHFRQEMLLEAIKQGLNIIHSVSFPTDTNPHPFVQNLQVGY